MPAEIFFYRNTSGAVQGYTNISEEWFDYKLRALEGLKAALTTAPVLAVPSFSKPWVLLADCSDTTMGACLAQLDEHGIERHVAYASCNLSTAQNNYGITDRGGLAIAWAAREWRLARSFVLDKDIFLLESYVYSCVYYTKLLGHEPLTKSLRLNTISMAD